MINWIAARDLAAVLCFGGFVIAALWSRYQPGHSPGGRKRRATVFIVYALVISVGVGYTERDLFPFTSWTLIAWRFPRPAPPFRRIVAVDADNREHEIDYRAWQPMGFDELASWVVSDFLPRFDRQQKDETARDLLDRVNRAATQARTGGRPGDYGRFLGPFTAPFFHLHPALWNDPGSAPTTSFSGLRLYLETWEPEERVRDPKRLTRELIYEYRADP